MQNGVAIAEHDRTSIEGKTVTPTSPPAADHTAALVVAIPTFNRKEAVTCAVQSLLARPEIGKVTVLVSDNASSDGTVESLNAIAETHAYCQLVAGTTNRGWWGQIERIADHSSAEYVMLLSDEDDAEDLSLLLHTLHATRPSFAVPKRKLDCRVRPAAIWANSTYLSGIVIRRDSLVDAVRALQQVETNPANQFLTVYPQVAILFLLWLRGDDGVILKHLPYSSVRQRLPGSWYPKTDWELPVELAQRIDADNPGRAAFKSLAYQLELLHDLSLLALNVAPAFTRDGSRRATLRRVCFERWLALRTARLVDEQLAWQYPRIYQFYRRGVLRRHMSLTRFFQRGVAYIGTRLRIESS